MINISHTKAHLENFIKKKKENTKTLTSQMYKEIQEIKRLDSHIREFSKKLDKDLNDKNIDDNDVFKHAKLFEKSIHNELDDLFSVNVEDLKLYISILKNLNDYKLKIYRATGSNKFGLTTIEMKYAKMNIDQINDKLKNLKKIFKELKWLNLKKEFDSI